MAGFPKLMRAPTFAVMLCVIGAYEAIAATKPANPSPSRVDLQVGLCAPADEVERALELRSRGAPFEVWLFDDDALSLFARGVRLRLRMKPDGAELTLKVADQDCAQLEPGLVPSREGKCEYDSHGLEVTGAVSLSRTIDARLARDLISGRQSVAGVLSPSQIRFLRTIEAAWPLPQDIRALGPQRVHSWRAARAPYLVDVTTLPSGDEFIELSRKVRLTDAVLARAELDRDLARARVASCADQSGQAINKLRALAKDSRK